MTDHQLDVAFSEFKAEYLATHEPRAALRAALIGFEARQQTSPELPAHELLDRHRELVAALCRRVGADFERVCSHGRAGQAETIVRGVLVGVLMDAGNSQRDIAVGIGLSQTSVNHLHFVRSERPVWQKLITEIADQIERAA